MTSTVATDIPQSAAPKTFLETWGKNERMRHIPSIEWITQKVDGDLRRRIDILMSAVAAVPTGDPRRPAIETECNALCRALDRLADAARHSRSSTAHNGFDIAQKIREALTQAVANLNAVDPSLFGRRYPFQTFERSKGEPLIAALLLVVNSVHRLTALMRQTDSGLDERLLEGIVTLQEPLREQPIAQVP